MSKRYKQIDYLAVISILIMIGTFLVFRICYSKVYDLILAKDVEQMVLTSRFVTKLVEREIENKTSELNASAKLFRQYDADSKEQAAEQLELLCGELDFEEAGIFSLQGAALDNRGESFQLEDDRLLEAITQKEDYISHSLDGTDRLVLAAPILNLENEVVGGIWGHYRIENISESIELNSDSHRYFQIIDNSGAYISDSSNIHVLTQENNIWEELKRYELSDDTTIQKIQQDVAQGNSGQFYFSYQGAGRYVAYEPLGINNWYVFSVLIEDYLSEYVSDIEMIFRLLIAGIVTGILILAVVIGRMIYRTTALIKRQNEILTSKNSLLFLTLKHTNDIPFEIDLTERTICLYYARPEEKAVLGSLDDFYPEEMLKHGVIEEQSYESYRYVFDQMLNRRRQTEPLPLRFRINGSLNVNQIYYEFVGDDKIVGCLEDYNEQAQQSERIEEINQKSQLDGLTKLYNRVYFKTEVDRRIQELRRGGDRGYSALFMMDLDCFKQANDTLGHLMGDQILKESAMLMKDIAQSTDLCGRLGGDEFVLFVQDACDLNAIRVCAEKINAALNRTYSSDGRSVAVSVSIGIAILTTENSFTELYQLADQALYQVKATGKNSYRMISRE